jgi:hypothetical protein
MERFYFHIRANGRFVPDDEGMLFSHLEGAIAELNASARDLWKSCQTGSIEMTDDSGAVLQTMLATSIL